MISQMRILLLLVSWALPAQALAADPIAVLERRELRLEAGPESTTHALRLTLVYFKEGGWAPEAIVSAASEIARILGQCGLALAQAELVRLDAPARYRYYLTPVSRELARAAPMRKPAIYFVIDTRQRPAFDAEAIGRGNSGARPELADTVWVAHGTRDLGIVLAHEIAHVLMDSGEHSEEAGNLMRDETAAENTRLSDAQCIRLRAVGTANGLLSPTTPGARLR